jgi:arylformamidase
MKSVNKTEAVFKSRTTRRIEQKMRIYDLSVPLYPGMLQWPDDPRVCITQTASIKHGDPYTISQFTCGTHSGTHIDAPYHFTEHGKRIDQVSLTDLIGEALVVQVDADRITAAVLRDIDVSMYRRILFKTRNSELLRDKAFHEEYVSLELAAAELLVEQGVNVVGIDYLSIEAYDSADHPVHKLLTEHDVVILEGLDLSAVEPGAYFLVALPLKLQGADGAPARVVLVEF